MSRPSFLPTIRRRTAALLLAAFSATLIGVVGCASLPTIVPDMARGKASPMVEDAKGAPLSAGRTKEVLERLKGSQPNSGVLERHIAFEEAITGTPLSIGNRVTLLEDGPRTYDAMLAAIKGARDHVNMESYIFDDDEAGLRFTEALLERQKAGVQVSLIHDSVGTLRTKKAFFDKLRAAGIKVLEYNPVNPAKAKAGWDVNERDHRKLLIIDGTVAFMGGINISSVYSSGSIGGSGGFSGAAGGPTNKKQDDQEPWRDTDLRIEGPVVADFQKLFFQTWEKQKGEPIPPRNWYPKIEPRGKEVVRAIGSAPDDPFSLIYATFISAIEHAEREVLLTNAYFVPDPQLIEVLKRAVARGVDVRIVLPGRTDSALVFHAGRSYYDELLSAKIRIYERRNALLHAKTALIDGVWSTVGSTNLDWRSFLHNQELNAVVLGDEFGQQMRRSFEDDVSKSEEITLEKWRDRSIVLRAKEAFSRLWQYWL